LGQTDRISIHFSGWSSNNEVLKMKSTPYLSVVIPVYNGEKTIKELHKQLTSCLIQLKVSYEIIFVHDCGKDKSLEKLQDIVNSDSQYSKLLSLTRNFGQHNAIIAGIEVSQGHFILTMDEDLQHRPVDIELLLETQKKGGYDVVYGVPMRKNHNSFRNVTSGIMKRLISFAIPELHEDYSAFRLIEGSIARELPKLNNSYTFLDGYLSWLTTNFGSCEVKHDERLAGESSYDLRKLVEHAINILVTFSILPLRLVTYAAIGVFLFDFCFVLFSIYNYIYVGLIAPGYTTLVSLLGLGLGTMMLAIGIIGEYVHRINLKTTNRPNYKVRK
jgi:polyisoprenyl-phosphate glycosyltransferase